MINLSTIDSLGSIHADSSDTDAMIKRNDASSRMSICDSAQSKVPRSSTNLPESDASRGDHSALENAEVEIIAEEHEFGRSMGEKLNRDEARLGTPNLKVENHIEILSTEQVASRQNSKNNYTDVNLEAWPLYQLFVDYPQLFLGLSALGTTVFLLMLKFNFFVAVVLSAATPFVLFRIWKFNPKALMILIYSLCGIVAVISAVFIQLEMNALE